MPEFFSFQRGNESSARPNADASPLLGRFRAVPGERGGPRKKDSFGALFQSVRAYGTIFGSGDDDDNTDEFGNRRSSAGGDGETFGWGKARRAIKDLWLEPKQGPVRRCVGTWWSRWGVLVLLPAAVVSLVFSFSTLGCVSQKRVLGGFEELGFEMTSLTCGICRQLRRG
jgi:hypothetical protein